MDGLDEDVVRYRQALGAARTTGWLAVIYAALALALVWLLVPGHPGMGPGGVERRFATWHVAPGLSLETPIVVALVTLTFPPLVAFAAGVLALRASRRDVRHVPAALGLGAAGAGLGVLPGLFVTLSAEWTDGTSRATYTSGGMSGVAFLFLAGAYLYTMLRHGRALRAGDPSVAA